MNLATFYDAVRAPVFGGKLSQSQVDGMGFLLSAMEKAHWPIAHAAYGLATAFHETARTMLPIAEYGKGKGKAYGVPDKKTGQTYYGRGYVQLTWLFNYEKAQDELGQPLVSNPDLAMRADIAADVMVRGMQEGWFTGKANRAYLDKAPPDYVNARRIINGTDKAALIAGYATKFEAALKASGYGAPVPANTPDAVPVEALPQALPEPPPATVRVEPIPNPSFLSRFFSALARRLKGAA